MSTMIKYTPGWWIVDPIKDLDLYVKCIDISKIKHLWMDVRSIRLNGEDKNALAEGLNGVLLIELMSSSSTFTFIYVSNSSMFNHFVITFILHFRSKR